MGAISHGLGGSLGRCPYSGLRARFRRLEVLFPRFFAEKRSGVEWIMSIHEGRKMAVRRVWKHPRVERVVLLFQGTLLHPGNQSRANDHDRTARGGWGGQGRGGWGGRERRVRKEAKAP